MRNFVNSTVGSVWGVSRLRWASALLAGSLLASGAAVAQTTFGAATTIVFPVVAATATFTGQITLYNPNANTITVNLSYYDANNLPSPGPKPCNAAVIPANASVQFDLATQCTLGAGSHFGLLIGAEVIGTNLFYGYSRTQNNAGAGFSIEGFPINNFTTQTSYSTGLQRVAAAPTYQTNCFVGSLSDPVGYNVKLFDGTTGAQIGTTISGNLNAFEQFRYLDIFSAASAPAGDYTNVRAEFSRTTAGTQVLIGFCTVQDNTSFGADFRVAKSPGGSGALTSTPWGGPVQTIASGTVTFVFAGPTATVALTQGATLNAFGTASFARVRITPPEGGAQRCATAGLADPTPTGGATWLPSSGPLANWGMGEPGPASSCRQRIASGHLKCWRRRCAPIVTLIRSLGRTKRARRRGGRRGSQRRKTFRASPNEGAGSMTTAGSETPSRAASSERKVRRILG